MRKFYIGFISLAAVLAVYLLYSRLDTTDLPDTAKQVDFINTVTDSNLSELESKVGRIGDVGVGTVEKANFITRNENREVVREVGFERLLNKSSDIWETERPFINIYRPNFICKITADTGTILVETAVGQTTPKDATFTSNVVVHIVPVGPASIKESYIYLDDITFLSDKSLLSTDNSVRYVSEDARMTGTGLELVYDDVLERLDYLWIIDLESLHIKSSQAALLTGSKKQPEEPADPNDRLQTNQPNESGVALDDTKTQTPSTQPVPDQGKGEYYNCVFSKNVLIDSPEELVFAQDKIFINDIFWSKSSSSQPDETAADTGTAAIAQPNNTAKVAEQSPQIPDNTDIKNIAAKPGEPNESPDKQQDIVITCDNGFIIALKDSPKILEKLAKTAMENTEPSYRRPEKFDRAEGRRTFLSRRINYNALTDEVIATGASELKFYTADLGQPDPNKPPLPVTVTAQQQVRFLPASNLAFFEGDCQAEMLQTDPNFLQQYTLLAPKFTIHLAKDVNDRASASTPGIEHFTADGGLVRLVSKKTAGKKQLGGIQLESRKLDYDPGKGLFVATGPGIIQMDNSNISPSTTQTGKFSLSKPCYAVVREFETLKYLIQKNQIVADAPSEDGLIIDYFPALNGKAQLDQQATVTTPHIQADLIKTASGQSKLSTLSAAGGIVYVDQDKLFEGSSLFYDAGKSLVTVKGDELRPCSYNGSFAGAIEWDLKTDSVKTDVAAPAILQLK